MPPKGKSRTSRRKTRKFFGNQHAEMLAVEPKMSTEEQSLSSGVEDSLELDLGQLEQVEQEEEAMPSTSTPKKSASVRKLIGITSDEESTSSDSFSSDDDEEVSCSGFRLIDMTCLSTIYNSNLQKGSAHDGDPSAIIQANMPSL